MNENEFFIDLGLLFIAALGGAILAQLLRQPLIVGYVVAGMVIGPFTPGPTIANPHPFEQFAEIGVILLMFTIEDLAVVVMTMLIPALSPNGGGDAWSLGRGLLLAAVILIPIVWLAGRVIPRILVMVARSGNEELLVLTTVTIGVATAALTVIVGLSHALGAFLAGMMISESEPAHRALDRVLPIRDVFVAVFFVSVGMLIRPMALIEQIPTVAAMVLLVTAGKFAVWTGIVRAAGYSTASAMLAGLGMTQIGEFSYILGKVGVEQGLIERPAYDAILGTSLVTILINALTFRRYGRRSVEIR